MILLIVAMLLGYGCAVFGVAYAFEMYDRRAFAWGLLALIAPILYLPLAKFLFPGAP